ncbi:MAG: hypothetical protein PHY45_03730 [Rhodocyclaceae bacterium]|nr:hypothetical protein [Rhodocyclaceae bacterium]
MTAPSVPGADPAPAFATAAACRSWLETAPLTDAGQMLALFLRELKALNRATLAAAERLEILELLRGPLYDAQEEFSRRFVGKPQPLAAAEQAAFSAASAAWHALVTGYMRCAEACFANDARMKSKAALVLQRALAALVAEQLATHRVSRQPTAEHWRVLHQLYAAAEQLDVAGHDVADVARLGKSPGSPQAAYAEALLLAAANLHEHGQRQIGWAARWTRRWAAKIRVLKAAPTSSPALPLCVDLASELPAGYAPLDTPGARWLDTTELRHSIKKRLALLAQGEAPARLNLGEDCTQPACEQLLTALYQRWCKGAAGRGLERRPASGPCRLVAGAEAIHYYLSGRKPFKQVAPTDLRLLRREQEEIATFGRVATHRDENFSAQYGFAVEVWQALEDWHMIDASAAGMRIARPLGQSGARIGHRQLIAVSPPDAQSYLLGCVRWTLVADTLEVGLQFFPGRPEPIALRGAGLAAAGEQYRPGFLLAAVPAIRQEASLVMPVGTFKLGRTLEVFAGQPRQVRLTRLVERGADFERATYEPA